MADFANCAVPRLAQDATTLFTVLRDSPDLLAALADFQIEADDEVARGLDLVAQLQARIAAQTAEAGEAVLATGVKDSVLARLELRWTRDRKLGRVRHARGTEGYRALGLAGDVPDADDAMVGGAEAHYGALDATPALYDGVRGITPKTVTDALALVVEARQALSDQARESGEAQQATALRRDAEARLRALAAEVAAVCAIALDDQPQARERLGLFERGNR